MRRYLAVFTLITSSVSALGQHTRPAADASSSPLQVRAQASLVQVPTLVRDRTGSLVFTLKPQDFTIRDNGIEQEVALDSHISQQPLALVVVVQTGGAAVQQLPNLRGLPTMIEAIVGNAPHRVALIAFDSKPHLMQDFTPNLTDIDHAIRATRPGDGGAAILDALAVSINMVRKQPPEMHRAVLLISGTVDRGSQTTLHQAVRVVNETNTAIYSIAFSSSKTEMKAALANTPPSPASTKGHPAIGPASLNSSDTSSSSDQTQYSAAFSALSTAVNTAPADTPLSPSAKGCSQHAAQSVGARLGDHESCASFMPLVLFAARLGMNGLSRNAPETVARMSGGEYRTFDNEKGLEVGLYAFANHLPNRYILSFQPRLPAPGLHTIQVTLKNYPKLLVAARTSYWVGEESIAEQHSQ